MKNKKEFLLIIFLFFFINSFYAKEEKDYVYSFDKLKHVLENNERDNGKEEFIKKKLAKGISILAVNQKKHNKLNKYLNPEVVSGVLAAPINKENNDTSKNNISKNYPEDNYNEDNYNDFDEKDFNFDEINWDDFDLESLFDDESLDFDDDDNFYA